MMKKLSFLIEKAKYSRFDLFILNRVLAFAIPFNKPHGLKIIEVSNDLIRTFSPYKRSNFNHIKGIHACCIATVSEFSAGILLISKLDSKQYRLIMSDLSASYHYQAKKDLTAVTELNDDTIQSEILNPLKDADKVIKEMITKVYDSDENHVATVKTMWQIKSWNTVKTKV